jgi:cytidylate kinase
MGTVVFPDAPVKFFVDARLEIRAARRVEQLRAKGQEADIESVSAELAARDERDATRATAPMKPASGAVIVDNSDTPLEQTVERMLGLVRSRMWAGSQR